MTKAAELAKMGEVLTNSQIGGRRNIVINGAMQVAQRSASVTGLGAATGYFTCDRWQMAENDASAGRFTMSQTADGPNGVSANCLKLDCTTADTSIAAGEVLQILQKFEGQDLQSIGKGTTGAKEITVSFYVKASAAFDFVCELYDLDNGRQISKLFSTTTGWVRHEFTFPADVDDGSSPFDDDNAASLQLSFWLHGGSTFTSGTLNTASWANATNANRAAGIDSFFSSTDNNFFITGVQLEVGSQATPFEHRSFGEELALCQRYYEVTGAGQPAKANSTTGIWCGFQFKTQKRAAPSISLTAANQRFFEFGVANRDTSSGSLVQTYLTTKSCLLRIEGYSGITAGNTYLSGGLVSDETADTFIAESEL